MRNFIWDDDERIWNRCLSKISWAIKSIYNTTTKYSPAQLVFNRDMILNTQSLIDWDLIRQNKHSIAIRNNIKENSKRIEYEYNIGDEVLLDYNHRKLDQPYDGPYQITQIRNNSTITLQKGSIETTVNIRQLHPFWRRRCNGDRPEPVIL